MPLEKLNGFKKKVADLPDVPMMSSAELKSYFDSSVEELRVAFNKAIDLLGSHEDFNSGADAVCITPIEGFVGENVQWVLENMKDALDKKTENTGDHKGTWAGYTPSTFPLGVTRDQMFLIPESQTIYAGQSGDRYPLGTSLMTVSGSQWGYPENFGMVVTHKYNGVRMVQWFHRPTGGIEAYYRSWTSDAGYGPWQKVATENSVLYEIHNVVKGGKIQSGTTTISIPGQSNATRSISFPETFGGSPAVTASVRNSSNPENFGDLTVTSVSNTGFTLVGRNNTLSTVTVSYSWIAMGG